MLFLGGCMASGTVRTEPAGPPPPPPREHDHRGPADPPPPPPPRHEEMRERIIEGRVFDAVTKQPIDGAAVDVASPATQGGTITINTDASGHYRSQPLPPDELHIRCRREHYAPESRVMRLQPGVTQLDCAMRRER